MTTTTATSRSAAATFAAASFANKVTYLADNLGPALTAFTLECNESTVHRWARGKSSPRALEDQRRIVNAYRIVTFLMGDDERSRHEVRSWFMGMNSRLDDESPAEGIRAEDYRSVMAAARAYDVAG